MFMVPRDLVSSFRFDFLLLLSKSRLPNSIAKPPIPSSDSSSDSESSSYSYLLILWFQSSFRLLRMLLPFGTTLLDVLSYSYPSVPMDDEGFIHFVMLAPKLPSRYRGMTGMIPSTSSTNSAEYWKYTGPSSISCSMHRNNCRSGNLLDFKAINTFSRVILGIVSCITNRSLKCLCSLLIQFSRKLACLVISLWAIFLAVLDMAKSVSAVLGTNRY